MKSTSKILNMSAICLASILGFGVSANAQDSGNYLTFGLGITETDDTSIQIAPGTVDTEYDDDWNYSAAYGWKRDGYRYELELVGGEDEVDFHTLNGGAPLAGSTGGINMLAVMFNGYYDFSTASAFTPYVAGGLGIAMVEAEGFGAAAAPDVVDDDDTVFAYQAMAGIGYDINEKTNIFAEYRYFGADSVDLTTSAATGSVDTDIDYGSSQFRFGVRINL